MVATSGRGWRLAPSLVRLMDEVDARWPNRRKNADGSIGDQSHAARSSEHNPDRDPDPMPAGYVSAVDITKHTAAQMREIRDALIGDPRTWYVIHDGKIYSRTHRFQARDYDGPNPHTGHLHVSLMQTRTAAEDTRPWGIARDPGDDGPEAPAKVPAKKGTEAKLPPTLQRGSTDLELLGPLQRFLGMDAPENVFGHRTEREVRRYQAEQRLRVDGVVGPKTWTRILQALKLKGYNA